MQGFLKLCLDKLNICQAHKTSKSKVLSCQKLVVRHRKDLIIYIEMSVFYPRLSYGQDKQTQTVSGARDDNGPPRFILELKNHMKLWWLLILKSMAGLQSFDCISYVFLGATQRPQWSYFDTIALTFMVNAEECIRNLM